MGSTAMRRAALAAVVVLGFCGVVRADDAEVEKLRAQNAALKQKVAELEAELANTKTAATEAELRAAVAQKAAAAASAERDAVVAQKTEIEAERREYLLDRSYDAAADRTTITSRVSPLAITEGAKFRHWMNLTAGFAGEKPTGEVKSASMVIQTAFSGQIYKGVEELTLTIDGAERTLAVGGYDSLMRSLGTSRNKTRRDDETVTVEVPVEVLAAIGEAKTVTGEIARNRFVLSHDHREMAAVLAKQLSER